MADLPFQCSCGKIAGIVKAVGPGAGTHAECFCTSCRKGEVYSGAPDPAPDPVGVYQTSPYRVEITQGKDCLAVFSFGKKNLLRWRATCCATPMFNTPRNPKVSFVGIRTSLFADVTPLGPVVGQGFIPARHGKVRHTGLRHILIGALGRIGGNLISGRWKETPLFDVASGTPITPVTQVSRKDNLALLP